ncbi:Predicted metal-dependent enzyme [Brachyspira hyodysenteriae WA1]|uniref:Predicted metal-dependent enzyme n=1 Tax=Brachyspira hyodysenteriae (strain ATCC 49526 / WA1) TaxID=565034 RepID=A0A3B6VDW3_BRAHW|nr:Predicted metal-dependent enzyme [Brachyspira hyodysenteriae WA1]AUJ48741.1 metal-dependent enzyme [Brachyspira hyodysenteriae]
MLERISYLVYYISYFNFKIDEVYNLSKKLDENRIKEGVGGQAVIEGIMLRNRSHYVVAVRKPDKQIDFIKASIPENKNKLSKMPFIRGIVNFVDMMKLGYKTLVFSANTAGIEEENNKKDNKPKSEKSDSIAMTLSMLVSLAFAVGLFIALPYFITTLIGIDEKSNFVVFNLVRGCIKLSIFVLYLLIISFFKDIKRVFEYHGAEHMVVNAYEHGLDPDTGNIRDYTTIHPRCGTTFMFLVLTVSILLYMFTSYFVYTYIYASYTPPKIIGNLTVLAINIILLPIVSGISYEILKLGFKFYNFPLMRLAILPGLALQKITTRRPQDDEIEVALFALSKLLDTSIENRTEEEVQADIKKALEINDNIKDNATEEKLCV